MTKLQFSAVKTMLWISGLAFSPSMLRSSPPLLWTAQVNPKINYLHKSPALRLCFLSQWKLWVKHSIISSWACSSTIFLCDLFFISHLGDEGSQSCHGRPWVFLKLSKYMSLLFHFSFSLCMLSLSFSLFFPSAIKHHSYLSYYHFDLTGTSSHATTVIIRIKCGQHIA